MGSRLLFDTNVSSKHPLKQADSGGPAPIEAGRQWRTSTHWSGGCPDRGGRYLIGDDLSHRQRQPVAPVSYANQIGLITLTAASRVGFAALQQHRSDLSGEYGDPGLPGHQDPRPGLADVVQRNAKQYIWHQLGCRSCRKVTWYAIQPP